MARGQNSLPTTDARSSTRRSAGSRLSRRAARSAWIEAGSSISSAGSASAPIIAASCSAKSGLPSAVDAIRFGRTAVLDAERPDELGVSSSASCSSSRAGSEPARARLEQLGARDAEQHERARRERCDVLDEVEHRRLGPVEVLEADERAAALARCASRSRRTAQNTSSLGSPRIRWARTARRRSRTSSASDIPVEGGRSLQPAEVGDELPSGQYVMPLPYGRHRPVATSASSSSPRRPPVRDGTCQSRPGRGRRRCRTVPASASASTRVRMRVELLRPADERRVEAACVAGSRGVHLVEPEAGDGLALALGREPLARPDPDRVLHERVRRRADQDRPRLGGLLESLGEVDRVTGHERLARPGVARDDLTGVDADPAGELDAPLHPQLRVELGEAPLHLRPGADSAKGVVLVDHRHAEHGHHLVAAEPLDRPAVRRTISAIDSRVARHDAARRLGIGRLAERRRADDVAEEDRHGLPDLEALPARPAARHRRSAKTRSRRGSTRRIVTRRHRLSLGRPGLAERAARPCRYADGPCSTRSPTGSRTPSATSGASPASTRRPSHAPRARSASRSSRPTSTSRSSSSSSARCGSARSGRTSSRASSRASRS